MIYNEVFPFDFQPFNPWVNELWWISSDDEDEVEIEGLRRKPSKLKLVCFILLAFLVVIKKILTLTLGRGKENAKKEENRPIYIG